MTMVSIACENHEQKTSLPWHPSCGGGFRICVSRAQTALWAAIRLVHFLPSARSASMLSYVVHVFILGKWLEDEFLGNMDSWNIVFGNHDWSFLQSNNKSMIHLLHNFFLRKWSVGYGPFLHKHQWKNIQQIRNKPTLGSLRLLTSIYKMRSLCARD